MPLLNPRLDTLFLRAYLGILSSLIGLLLISSLIFMLVNQVRGEIHQESLAKDLSYLLTHSLATSEQTAEDWLKLQSQALNVPFKFITHQQAQLTTREQRRLAEQRPLLRQHGNALEVLQATQHPGQLLVYQLERPQEQILTAQAQLLAQILLANEDKPKAKHLAKLQTSLHLPVHLSEQATPASIQLQYQEQDPSLSLTLPLTEELSLVLGPTPLFNLYPLGLLIILSILVTGLLGMSIWWFLHRLDHRLRSLERASSQLAAGNLQARVGEEEKDFIGKLATSFNHMADQIQRLLRTQQEMIHAVSHELRTPVARIRFGLQMIEDLTEQPHSQQDLLRQTKGIDKDIDELDTLIDEILTYARLGQEQLKLQFIEQEVTGLVEDVIHSFARVNPQLTFDFKVHNPHHYASDADLEGRYFQRALQNLLGNAVRYAASHIQVHCYLEADTLRVDVEDDGPGIPEQDWERVFMPFSRLDDSRTRSSGGYGLGLSIVQRIIFWHRGSALVDRSPALGGARFSLIFPKSQSNAPTGLTGSPQTPQQAP